ncbi:MAG: acetylornithine deacetylase [Acidobacteriaceae bacterium]|nr:acetylornithine deacetylase [Acidobacteriaceae bacterium]MBV9502791.1 acetylornithine deacetylase [Acidobacteriaceae bacterium]
MKTCAEILTNLISIPSVSIMSNRAVIEYAREYFDPQRWRSTIYAYPDSAGIEKLNLVAITGRGDERSAELPLVCHTDTVAFADDWSEAVRPAVRDGKLYGRGSCDVKGFLACLLAVIQDLDPARLARRLAVVLTADEETGCVGAKHLASWRAFESRFMIIGEPTGLAVAYAGKGYGLGQILVRGKAAHSAFPAQGRSAIRDGARVMERLDVVAARLASQSDPDLDPPVTTLNVGLISGGTAKNIIPEECRITVEWRPIPGQDPQWTASLISEQLARLAHEFPGFDAQLEVQRLDPPFGGKRDGRLTMLLESLTNRCSRTVSFGTEAAHLAGLASEIVVFGPGDMTVAHRTGEFVALDDLEECVRYLRVAVDELCGSQ